MKEKIIKGIQWYDEKEKYFLSAAGILYVALTILSWSLLFKLSDSWINDVMVILLSILRKGVFIIFGISIANEIYHKRLDWKLALGFFGISVFSTVFSKNAEPIKMAFAIIALSNLSFYWTLRDFYNAERFILLLVIVLASLGIVENAIYDTERMRFGLGFDSSTTSAVLIFHILIFYECIRTRKWTNTDIYLYLLSIILIFIATNSRFIFIMSVLYMIAIGCQKRIKNFIFKHQKIKWVLISLPLVLCLGTLLISVAYDSHNQIWITLNNGLSDRLLYSQQALEKYGISVFGQSITWNGNNYFHLAMPYNYVDNSYLKFLLEFGGLLTVVYLGLLSYGVYSFYKEGKSRQVIAIIFLMILGIIESFLFVLIFNPFLIYGYQQMNEWIKKKTIERKEKRLENSL